MLPIGILYNILFNHLKKKKKNNSYTYLYIILYSRNVAMFYIYFWGMYQNKILFL